MRSKAKCVGHLRYSSKSCPPNDATVKTFRGVLPTILMKLDRDQKQNLTIIAFVCIVTSPDFLQSSPKGCDFCSVTRSRSLHPDCSIDGAKLGIDNGFVVPRYVLPSAGHSLVSHCYSFLALPRRAGLSSDGRKLLWKRFGIRRSRADQAAGY